MLLWVAVCICVRTCTIQHGLKRDCLYGQPRQKDCLPLSALVTQRIAPPTWLWVCSRDDMKPGPAGGSGKNWGRLGVRLRSSLTESQLECYRVLAKRQRRALHIEALHIHLLHQEASSMRIDDICRTNAQCMHRKIVFQRQRSMPLMWVLDHRNQAPNQICIRVHHQSRLGA